MYRFKIFSRQRSSGVNERTDGWKGGWTDLMRDVCAYCQETEWHSDSLIV